MEKKGLLHSLTSFLSTVRHLPETLQASNEQEKQERHEAWRIARERGWTQFLGSPYAALNRANERAVLIAAEKGTLPRFNDCMFKPLNILVVVPGSPNPFVEAQRQRLHAAASQGDAATQGR